MAEVTVSQLAETVGTPIDKLLAQMKEAGLAHTSADEVVSDDDFGGERVMMDNRYKLLIGGQSPDESGFELYDILNDLGETTNLSDTHPEIVTEMNTKLREWQESVLKSLTGADYK